MSSTLVKQRIHRLSRKLAEMGVSGRDMTEELRKMAREEDLSRNEILRIAEEANRKTQLELFKRASDRRFKFKLADGRVVADELTTEQTKKPTKTLTEKEASYYQKLDAINEVGGDPYAVPYRSSFKELSFAQASVQPDTVKAVKVSEALEQYHKLAKLKEELLAVQKEAQIEATKVVSQAFSTHKQAIQSAVDLIAHGISLSSLYDAIIAGLSGSNSGVDFEDAVDKTDEVMLLIIHGLKERGIPNHRFGFRYAGDPDEFDRLPPEKLLELCKRESSYQRPQDLTMRDVKTASSYREWHAPESKKNDAPLRPEAAEAWLNERPSQNRPYAVPDTYLEYADNFGPDGKVRAYNTNSQFIVSIRDLVGAQDRLRRCHAAQEYIGLKLKRIDEALGALASKIKRAEAGPAGPVRIRAVVEGEHENCGDDAKIEHDEEKVAYVFVPALIAAGRGLASSAGRALASSASAAQNVARNAAGYLKPKIRRAFSLPRPEQGLAATAYRVARHPVTGAALAVGSSVADANRSSRV